MRVRSVVVVAMCSSALGCWADAREFGEVLEGASGGMVDDDSGESGEVVGLVIEASEAVGPIFQVVAADYADDAGVEVEVKVTDSSASVNSVGAGRSDVGGISRDLTQVELERHPSIGQTAFALDGIAIVVNVDNPIDDLALEQVADIYSGRATDWMHVGGDSMPLTVISRPPGSELGRVFGSVVLGDTPLREDAEQLDSSGQMELAVSDDIGAIAYIGVGSVGPSVKTLTIDGQVPDPEVVTGGDYPITRRFLLLMGDATDVPNLAQDFIDYVDGPAGAAAVADAGYIPAP